MDEQVTHEGFCERAGNKAMGACLGIFLFLISFGILVRLTHCIVKKNQQLTLADVQGWNEGRFVHTQYDINMARTTFVPVPCSELSDSVKKSKNILIYTNCPLDVTKAEAQDPHFGVKTVASISSHSYPCLLAYRALSFCHAYFDCN
jgi:hypothetical protein